MLHQTTQRNGAEQSTMVIEDRRRAERPRMQRLFKMLLARGFCRLARHRRQRQGTTANDAFCTVAAVTKPKLRQLFYRLRIAATAENTG
ncbi:hypothetical protein SDC9_199750 [bioreactor metagenome]|uniref:Uncharacterized protein n=1 Tax=bioreactor metagenome TaxID=1076179 RepID=A0A645IM30_9ZZZZ